jgi:hypothetical protein
MLPPFKKRVRSARRAELAAGGDARGAGTVRRAGADDFVAGTASMMTKVIPRRKEEAHEKPSTKLERRELTKKPLKDFAEALKALLTAVFLSARHIRPRKSQQRDSY